MQSDRAATAAAPLVCRRRQKRVASLLERIGNSAGAVVGEYITPDFSLQLSCSAAGNHHAMHNNIIIHGAIKETCGCARRGSSSLHARKPSTGR